MRQESILVVDDEEVMRDVLGSLLTQAGFQVSLAESGPQGLALARKGDVDAAIVDVMLPDMGGLEVLEELKKTDPDLVVLMITAFASVETAITAMKKGAFDYVAKPFKHEELLHILRNGLNQRRLQDENRQLRTALKDLTTFLGERQKPEFLRLGGVAPIKVDVRLLPATTEDLKRALDEGRFREALY